MVAVSPARQAPRIIRPTGTSETRWQQCPTLAQVPTLPFTQLLQPDQRLVVVAPHPDDEILACGGLLALHSARGGATLVVAVTDGEASHPPQPSRSAQQLAHQRCAESHEGLLRLGVAAGPLQVRRLSLPDSALARHTALLEGALSAWLLPQDVVVTTWQLDGHPDHEACGNAVARACTVAGCRLLQAPVWMWHWGQPGDARVPWAQLVRVPLPAAVVARKQHALTAHTSQLLPARPGEAPILGKAMASRLARRAEYFFI
ncbi:MAG: PIG-L deacetylase family protein [Polaromonas sp.]